MPTERPIVAVEGITKTYPGVVALSNVSLDLRPGEVHALVGENGAGKSTLIRVLSGDTQPDAGTIEIKGGAVVFSDPSHARASGIVTIFQELTVIPWLSVAENVVLGNVPTVGRPMRFYSRQQAFQKTEEVLERLGGDMKIDVRAPASRLSMAQKQIIEIARALVLQAPVIIMDEPTAALSDNEAAALLRIVRQLRDEGRAILFVSHRLNEVLEIADRVTVLRGGEQISTVEARALEGPTQLIELMVGRPLSELFPARNEAIGAVVFAVEHLTRQGVFEDVSFDVRRGEVLGVAGLVGAGRTEVMRAIFGVDPLDSGIVRKDGKTLAIRGPRDAIAAGIAYLPEDRKDQGLVLGLSGAENVVMASMRKMSRLGFVDWSRVQSVARDLGERLRFHGRMDAEARTNSGGNQQKLVIGKWVATGSDVLIFDEPTRGIDIGAKVEVYRLIHALAERGAAVILVSSELPELMNVAHRLIVMSGGRIHDTLTRDEFEERRILSAAFAAHVGARQDEVTAA